MHCSEKRACQQHAEPRGSLAASPNGRLKAQHLSGSICTEAKRRRNGPAAAGGRQCDPGLCGQHTWGPGPPAPTALAPGQLTLHPGSATQLASRRKEVQVPVVGLGGGMS